MRKWSGPAVALAMTLALACPGCLESNPQPSPSRFDALPSNAQDLVREGADEVVAWGDAATLPETMSPPSDAAGEILADGVSGDLVDATPDDLVDATPGDVVDGLSWDAPGEVMDAITDGGAEVEVEGQCEGCVPPYPGCAKINGEWFCVQCTKDAHCGNGCTCDLTIYACSGDGCVGDVPDGCDGDEECGEGLQCHLESGWCYDPDGWCDDLVSFCHPLTGSDCVDPMKLMWGDDVPATPGFLTGKGVCSCGPPLPLNEAVACLADGSCAPGMCFPGQVCTTYGLLCEAFFGDCGDPDPDQGFCVGAGAFEWLSGVAE